MGQYVTERSVSFFKGVKSLGGQKGRKYKQSGHPWWGETAPCVHMGTGLEWRERNTFVGVKRDTEGVSAV